MLGALYPRFQFVNFTVYLLPQWLNQIMPRLFRFRVGVGCGRLLVIRSLREIRDA